jgi:hypothetical protein
MYEHANPWINRETEEIIKGEKTSYGLEYVTIFLLNLSLSIGPSGSDFNILCKLTAIHANSF